MTTRLIAVLLVAGLVLPVGAEVTLAREGQAALPVVFDAAAATPGEQTAAAELVKYLAKVTGATFSVAAEEGLAGPACAVFWGTRPLRERMGWTPPSWGRRKRCSRRWRGA